MRLPSVLLPLSLGAALVSGCASTAVERGSGASAAEFAPFESQFDYPMVGRERMAPLGDQGFVMLRQIDFETCALERYDRNMKPVWSTPIDPVEDELEFELVANGSRVFVLSTQPTADDKWKIVARGFDIVSGRGGEQLPLFDLAEHPDRVRMALSPDASKLLIAVNPLYRLERDANGKPQGVMPMHLAVIDKDLNVIQKRELQIVDAVIDDEYYYNQALPTNAGEIDLIYLYHQNDAYRAAFRRFKGGSDGAVLAYDDVLPSVADGVEDLIPADIAAARLPDNSVVAFSRLRDGDDSHAILRMHWDPATGRHESKELHAITEDEANALVDEDEIENLRLSRVHIAPQGDEILLMEQLQLYTPNTGYKVFASLVMKSKAVSTFEAGPIFALTCDRNGGFRSVVASMREEKGKGERVAEGQMFEGRLLSRVVGDTLFVVTRSREEDGTMLHAFDIRSGKSAQPRQLLRMGSSALLASGFSSWLNDDELLLISNDADEEWTMARVKR